MEYITAALIVICMGIETILTNRQIRDVLKIINNLECDLRFAEAKIEELEEQIKKGVR
jgi:ribosomal protein L12E/L44/L45/RPP1/RPP2